MRLSERLATPAAALLAFTGGRAVLWAAARRDRFDAWAPESWVRFDSEHYLEIARRGYAFARCGEGASYGALEWCGNTGWLPGYPLLIRALTFGGLSAPLAAMLIAAVAHLATLLLAARLVRELAWPRRLVLLLLVAAAPGQVYQHAVFPVSLFCLLALAAMDAAQHERWEPAALFGAAAAFSYSTGFLLAGVLALAVVARQGLRAPALRRAAAVGGATLGGFAAALALQWYAVGDPLAFFKVQAKYGHGLHSPLEPLLHALQAVRADAGDWIAWQTITVAALALALVAMGAVRLRRAPGLDLTLTAYAAVYWLFPLVVGGRLSLYRADALLMPAALLLRRLPILMQCVLVAAFTYLDYKMGIRFFRGVLV
jgi:hypothetical protein